MFPKDIFTVTTQFQIKNINFTLVFLWLHTPSKTASTSYLNNPKEFPTEMQSSVDVIRDTRETMPLWEI